MDVTVLRGKLHEYISIADELHLNAIYLLLEDKMPFSANNVYDEETLNMLHKRRESHLNGISKSYTAEDSIELVKIHKK